MNKNIESIKNEDANHWGLPPFLTSRFQNPSSTRGGQAMVTAVIFFLGITMTLVFGTVTPVLKEAALARQLQTSKQSYVLAESLSEDMTYRYKTGLAVDSIEYLTIGSDTAYATSTTVSGVVTIVSTGNKSDARRKVQTSLSSGDSASFHYGVQTDKGGVTFANSSSIKGNLFSNGPISGSGNMVLGDIISAGPMGSVSGMHATSSIYAHTISNSTADKNAYYQSISGSTVLGTSYPASADQATSSMPIPDSDIFEWESDAAAGGTATCSGGSYNVSSGAVTLGPIKIPCDLNISNIADITLAGPVWVTGTINLSNSADISVDASLSGKSVAIIADKSSNRSSGSKINISNSVTFSGAGSNSYILLVSMNNDAENGGGNQAMTISNNISGEVLVYAPHGLISLANSISLREVTSYKLTLSNSAVVEYKSGLASLLFTAGPSGGYIITDWKEVP
ncbi:MAG: hypothetical protein A2836_02685 [Candidatus Taylorbacteria bacterium RIFCSPHIGHO2_01_FULL_45_63]|uniref:Type 4 fimbrial biogenesis protein PilX N-terminal domain-containing protein n=1 Tax=Candidatus Taylorbacteria bacterium RIFCSPHIGHO2_02_FULL_45_35 TaxID=1802311 RepID=A0A1G2MR46_9BACT|nr:MAG: hypothetical protein A2836_02685 [Candidatus Taylorbacteria bacterium RIFCSPHIGHO2_01_FULL_45_63]OHA25689.1 MAG: hypothetical protein A3D56_00760 [Candidatus Taylorbacteria bacterium RIFCSPHIGHO2_02_FULL_45_35]OHA33964.1 MAG: hypothetical protein A3A22_04115 [Candidatus Taylorbacteria bacterium RIFCSPLOWO2_01_FULL_45_34b]QBM02310.1 hypothetical protein [uncultured archaeon]